MWPVSILNEVYVDIFFLSIWDLTNVNSETSNMGRMKKFSSIYVHCTACSNYPLNILEGQCTNSSNVIITDINLRQWTAHERRWYPDIILSVK
jgi:hypothetical protein